MLDTLPVRLPDCFYLPRASRFGIEIRDVMPWADAISYVTDGTRFGVEFRDGSLVWLLEPSRGVALADEYRIAAELLPYPIHVEASPREIVRGIFRENAT